MDNGLSREIRGGQYRPLSAQDIIKIHNASLEVLERAGIRCTNPEVLRTFREAGAYIRGEDRVCLSRWLIESAIFKAPSRIRLCGRDPKHDLLLEGERVHAGTGGSALNVIDLDTGKRRPALLADLARLARLVDALDNIDFFMRPLSPSDVPREIVDLTKWYTAFQNTTKHVMGSAFFSGAVDKVLRIAEIIQGGKKKLRERPILSFIVCWLRSPLTMTEPNTSILVELVKNRIPVVLSSAPMAGTTGPVTLAGTLVQMNAELLSGIALAQIVSPGCPVLYGAVPAAADLRTMSFASGAVETALLNAAAAQLAHHYEIPVYNTAGLTDSKVSDIQAGYEKVFGCVAAAMGGGNFIHDAAGMLESTLTVSYEQCVIDNEIIGMLKRMLRGIDVSEDTMAVETICSVGPDGHYVAEGHTLQHMRREFYYPRLSDRQSYDRWLAGGEKDARAKANEIAREILRDHHPDPLPDRVIQKIHKEFGRILRPYEKRMKGIFEE
jgi:trimethylamine--corrinoid protein Co-methyltransferase